MSELLERAGRGPVGLLQDRLAEADGDLVAESNSLSDEIKAIEEQLAQIDTQIEELLAAIPNLPDPSAPDGTTIYFVAPEPKTEEERARERARDDVYEFDEDFKNNHLWKVVVNTRSESRLTSGDFSVESYDLSGDGRTIAYQRAPKPPLARTRARPAPSASSSPPSKAARRRSRATRCTRRRAAPPTSGRSPRSCACGTRTAPAARARA